MRDYLWCSSQLGFQKFLTKILENTPVLEFGSRTPPLQNLKLFPESKSGLTQNTPKMKNSNFLSWVQIWAYPEHPPWKWKTLTFFAEFKSELTQNTPPQWKTLTFFAEFKSELTQNTPPQWKTLTFFAEFKSELTQNTPPPMKNPHFLCWVQIWAYPEHHHPPPPPENEKL